MVECVRHALANAGGRRARAERAAHDRAHRASHVPGVQHQPPRVRRVAGRARARGRPAQRCGRHDRAHEPPGGSRDADCAQRASAQDVVGEACARGARARGLQPGQDQRRGDAGGAGAGHRLGRAARAGVDAGGAALRRGHGGRGAGASAHGGVRGGAAAGGAAAVGARDARGGARSTGTAAGGAPATVSWHGRGAQHAAQGGDGRLLRVRGAGGGAHVRPARVRCR